MSLIDAKEEELEFYRHLASTKQARENGYEFTEGDCITAALRQIVTRLSRIENQIRDLEIAVDNVGGAPE